MQPLLSVCQLRETVLMGVSGKKAFFSSQDSPLIPLSPTNSIIFVLTNLATTVADQARPSLADVEMTTFIYIYVTVVLKIIGAAFIPDIVQF